MDSTVQKWFRITCLFESSLLVCGAMIAWLASEDNSFTTGAVFDISGGRATY
jgi:hypothetical protein